MRKTKIVCTLGPATDREGVLEALIQKGMDVGRFNFSHNEHEEHGRRMDELCHLREKYDKPVAILLDTKGPEIRLGDFARGKENLERGQMFTLTGRQVEGNDREVSITYPDLANEVSAGTRILIDDGLVELEVKETEGKDIRCLVKTEGTVSDHKGVNIPGQFIHLPYMSDRDRDDLLFGIEKGVDFVAASFVRCGEDVQQLRDFLQENGGGHINIIAKIENRSGVENIDDIIDKSDGIMVARGDMGVELPEEEVPVIQKMIIKKVYQAGKQVITATQMLESMVQHPRPTRAEVADVANAVYDGTSAIMLSGETAAGKYPVEALETMIRIATRAEEDIDYRKRFFDRKRKENPNITDAISHATCTTAYDLGAAAIVTVTKSGYSARMISRYRPACHIIGGTTSEVVSRQLSLAWGVEPILLEEKTDVFELFSHAVKAGKTKNMLQKGDLAVLTSGVPIGISGTTNMLKVEVVE